MEPLTVEFTAYYRVFVEDVPVSALRMSRPIVMKIVVPAKNQPKNQGADDIPTDTYWASWDGILVVVTWKHEQDTIPRSGGHVVLPILRDAAEKARMEVYNQPCSPGCKNVFTHSILKVVEDTSLNEEEFTLEGNVGTLRIPARSSAKVVNRVTFMKLRSSGGTFARLKNVGRQILDLESSAWVNLECLLDAYKSRIEAGSTPWWRLSGLRARWNVRGWRRLIRDHSARIWARITSAEHLAREWSEGKRRFEENVTEDGVGAILRPDFATDELALTRLDMSRLESLSNQVESRLDNRVLALATAGGAISGAIAGTLVSFLR
ncbi:hypothetical protein ACIRPX_45095 [Streptomyces sp. NPDC101225]|uniref:hypothetical protein n=1 Tax=Streptomyces sp. NPDC101225 TaxID=3366135 RepID=UPI00382261AA